jgi:predicted DNA-binding transcriptional regulator AlpA
VEVGTISEAAEKEPDYSLAKEVAEVVRLSEKSIYRIMKTDPTFPHVRISGSVRFPRARVLRWLSKRTQGELRRRSSPS